MPNRDGTGPNGKGKLTGLQMGTCKGATPKCRFGRGAGRNVKKWFRGRDLYEE